MAETSAERSSELFSKTSEMVPNGLNIPMYESFIAYSERYFSRTTFSGKHGILDRIPRNLFQTFEMVPNCSIWFQTANR